MHICIYFTFLYCTSAMAAGELKCLKDFEPRISSRVVGVETIHISETGPITILLPMPLIEHKFVFDLNAYFFGFQYPKQFAFSDGTLKTPFVVIDIRPGSRLDACLDELKNRVEIQVRPGRNVHEVLRTFIGNYLLPAPALWQPLNISISEELPPEFAAVANMQAGHYPVKTALQHPAVQLETYLQEGRGACLQKVLFTSLIMQKLNLKHQVRAGGSSQSGHMWIELPDGRILDPTWRVLEKPAPASELPNWFGLSQTLLFRNQFYPFAVDEL